MSSHDNIFWASLESLGDSRLEDTGGPAKGKPPVMPPQLFREDLMRSGPALREEIEVLSGRYSRVPVKELGAAGAR